jgi:hypothetical protein
MRSIKNRAAEQADPNDAVEMCQAFDHMNLPASHNHFAPPSLFKFDRGETFWQKIGWLFRSRSAGYFLRIAYYRNHKYEIWRVAFERTQSPGQH